MGDIVFGASVSELPGAEPYCYCFVYHWVCWCLWNIVVVFSSVTILTLEVLQSLWNKTEKNHFFCTDGRAWMLSHIRGSAQL